MDDPVLRLERLDTPTGRMLIVTDASDETWAVDWEDHQSRMKTLLRRYRGGEIGRMVAAPRASTAKRALAAYFDGDLVAIDAVPAGKFGTAFQRAAWRALRDIPAGRPITYGALAARIGNPKAVRAVGLANGRNPISIGVPCHRLIGADGSLTGYGGGIERKRWLLDHEGSRGMIAPGRRAELTG
jgi:methylated-DNA-[protein]-cysteine S-methyltransferase